MTILPVDKMVNDACALERQFCDGSNPTHDAFARDVVCHVKAMACEIESLRKALEWSTGKLMFGENKKFGELFPEFREYVWTPFEDE